MIFLKKEQTYQFITEFVKRNGFLPTYQEIIKGIGAKSKSMVKPCLLELERDGLIRFPDDSSRFSLTGYHLVKDEDMGIAMGTVRLGSGDTETRVEIRNGKIELYFPKQTDLRNWYHAVHVNTE